MNLGGQVRTNLLCSTLLSAVIFVALSFPLAVVATKFVIEDRENQRLTTARLQFEAIRKNFEFKHGPLSRATISRFLDYLLSNTFPDDDTFLVGIIGDQYYGSTPKNLPPGLRPYVSDLSKLSLSDAKQKGLIGTNNSDIGSILYKSLPILSGDARLGSFLVIITTAGETKEAEELISLLQRWFLGLYALSLGSAWLYASRITRPLKLMATAMDEVSPTNLDLRLTVNGDDELARMGSKFNEMLDRIESLVKSQKEFIRDISHELRTPITVIRGHTELIHLDPPEELPNTIRLVLDEVDRMSRIVSELSLLARSERPEFLQLSHFYLKPFLQDIMAKAQKLAPRVWCSHCIGNPLIMADPQRLTQCLMNLLLNASQHTLPEEKITLGGSLEPSGLLRLWVSDEGSGIEPELQSRVFKRFVQGESQRRDLQGSGLGLAIVHAIVSAHGGRISLESTLGSGTTFTILLPCGPTASPLLESENEPLLDDNAVVFNLSPDPAGQP
jgi:two-component system OmpR family sensor kinase